MTRPASQLVANNRLIGTDHTFARNVATIGQEGQAVAANEPRFNTTEPCVYTPAVQWSDSITLPSSSQLLATGWDHDGTTPLMVVRETDVGSIRVYSGTTPTLTATMSMAGTADILQDAVSGKRFFPRLAVMHYGMLLMLCERRTDVGGGDYQPEGCTWVYTNDYATLSRLDIATNSEAAGADLDLERLREWSCSSAFPLGGDLTNQTDAWLPWVDYLFTGSNKGGQIGLLRITREAVGDDWTVDGHRLIDEIWDAGATLGKHFHSAAVTDDAVWLSFGDGWSGLKRYDLDLDNYLTADITKVDITGADATSSVNGATLGDANDRAPNAQPVGTAPLNGSTFLTAGDQGYEMVLGITDNGSATPPTIQSYFTMFEDTAVSDTLVGKEVLHISWLPGVGWAVGGGSDALYWVSRNGVDWAQINSNYTGRIYWHGNKLIQVSGTTLRMGTVGPIRRVSPLMLNPGGRNIRYNHSTNPGSISAPATNVSKVGVYHDGTTYRYVSDDSALDPQPVGLPPADTPWFVEVTSTSIVAGSVGEWYLANFNSEWFTRFQQAHFFAAWIYNLAPETGLSVGFRPNAPGSGNDKALPQRFSTKYDNVGWRAVMTSGVHQSAGDYQFTPSVGVFASQSFTEGNICRFLIAFATLTNGEHPPYPTGPRADTKATPELLSLDMTASTEWTAAIAWRRPYLCTSRDLNEPILICYADASNYVALVHDRANDQIDIDVVISGVSAGTGSLSLGAIERSQMFQVIVSTDGTDTFVSAHATTRGTSPAHTTISDASVADVVSLRPNQDIDQDDIPAMDLIALAAWDKSLSEPEREAELIAMPYSAPFTNYTREIPDMGFDLGFDIKRPRPMRRPRRPRPKQPLE